MNPEFAEPRMLRRKAEKLRAEARARLQQQQSQGGPTAQEFWGLRNSYTGIGDSVKEGR